MSILSSVTAYQGPLTLLLIIFGPSLLPRLLTFLRIRNSPSPSQITKTPQTPRPLSLKLILGIHTLWVLKQLALPPYNLFASIPVSISNAHLRYIILGPEQPDGNAALHPLVELLLTRMKVMENRMTYLTFGHNPLMECVWCILGWNIISGHQASRRAERWRSTFGWALVVGAVGECGIKWIWDLRVIEGDALHLASTIHTIRSIYLLLSPIVYTFLPLPAEHVSPNTLIPIISNTTSTLRLTSLARAAVQRSGKLRETWTTIGMRDSERAEIAKRDEDVRDLVRALQLDEGGMKLSAAQWLREGWNGMIRVDSAPSRGL